MDNSWLFDNEEKEEEEESASDEEEKQTELEERLYAVVHHNDLSQPLPSELAKHYTVQRAENGELEVSLNNPLEVVKLADSEQICNLLNTPDRKPNASVSENNDDNDVIFVDEIKKSNDPKSTGSSFTQNRNSRKRFRYSDVTLSEFQGQEVGQEAIVESSTYDIYYFDHSFGMFQNKKHRKFKNLKVPPPPSSSDWRNDSNSSFVSVGRPHINQANGIISNMTKVLMELNPGEEKYKLCRFANILYKRNVQLYKRKLRRERRKVRKLNTSGPHSSVNDSSYNSSFNISEEISDLSYKIKGYNLETVNHDKKVEEHFNGSISLNISPFKPEPSTPHLLELSSDAVDLTACSPNTSKENSSPTTKIKNSHFPVKWTKEMIKFYSKCCKKKLDKDIDEIIANLKKKSNGKEWYLDPRDKKGLYQRFSPGMNRSRRCTNCNEFGHTFQNCYRPVRLPACTLCGELYHTDYSCPNKVCLKCGMFIMGDVFGGECNDCYYKAFNGEDPCSICLEVTHKSSNCTDLWRSFHGTTGGEKKIPDHLTVNKRKSCCNCGRKGHFSHECPFITYSGQQISSFVKNYSAEPLQSGSVDVIIGKNFSDIIYSDEADQFFHYLSDCTQAIIGVSDEGSDIVCKVNGTFEQCKRAKLEIENFVNTRKRKRQEPTSKRKRQRVRY